MPDCVDIHKPLCLLARLFYGSLYGIDAAVVDYLRPKLISLTLDEFVVARQGAAE